MANPSQPGDMNVYGLSMELALDTGPTFKALTDIEDKVKNLEKTISEAMQKSLDLIKGQVTEVSKIVSTIGDGFKSAAEQASKITSPLSDISSKDITQNLNDGLETFENLITAAKEFTKQRMLEADSAEQATRHAAEMNDQLDKHNKFFARMKKSYDDRLKIFIEFIEKRKAELEIGKSINGNTAENNKQLEKSRGMFREINDSYKERDIYEKMIYGHRQNEVQRLISAVEAYGMINKETERFTSVTFAAYGRQMNLVMAANELTTQYGILNEEALQTIEILGNMRIPREEMGKYAEAITKANKVTGIGTQSLAAYAKMMRSFGYNGDQATNKMNMLVESMRKFGLSADDMKNLTNTSEDLAAVLEYTFKEGSKALEQFTAAKAEMMGTAKALGLNEQAYGELLTKSITDFGLRSRLAESIGKADINNVDDLKKAWGELGKQADKALKEFDLTGDTTTLNALADSFQMGTGELRSFAKVATEAEKALKKLSPEQRKQLELNQELDKNFQRARDSAYGSLKMISDSFIGLGKFFQELTEAFYIPLFIMLGKVIQVIAAGMGYIRSFVEWADKAVFNMMSTFAGEYSSYFAKVVSGILGGLMIFGFFAGKLSGILTGVFSLIFNAASKIPIIGSIFGRLGSMVSSGATKVAGGGSLISKVFGSIKNTIVNAFKGVGEIFKAIGESVASFLEPLNKVVKPMLALGAAILMVGAGAYMFAKASVMVGDGGKAAAVGVAIMTVAMIFLMGVLVVLSTVGGVTAPVLYAIGGGMLMVAGAAWILVSALEKLCHLFWDVAKSTGPNSPPMWEKFDLIGKAMAFMGGIVGSIVTGISNLASGLWDIVESIWEAKSGIAEFGLNLGTLAVGMIKVSTAAIPFGLAMAGLAGMSWLTSGQFIKLGEAFSTIGAGLDSMSDSAQVLNVLKDSISSIVDNFSALTASLSNTKIVMSDFNSVIGYMAITAWAASASIISATGSISLAMVGLAGAAMLSLFPVSMMSLAWGKFGTLIDNVAGSVGYIKTNLEELIRFSAQFASNIGTAFRRLESGSDKLNSMQSSIANVEQSLNKLSGASDKLKDIQQVTNKIEDAITRLASTGEKLQSIKGAFEVFTSALRSLADQVTGGIGDKISILADMFNKLAASMINLANSFINMAATSNLNVVQVLQDQLNGMMDATEAAIVRLSDYYDGLDSLITKVNETKIKAETIQNIKVMNEDKDTPRERIESQEVVALKAQNELLQNIINLISSKNTDKHVETIGQLLEQYLPDLGESNSSGLASNYNNWGR